MKAQRESGQRFKSASSKPRRGRAFFHVNEPIDQKPDASIWTTMYTQWAPRGESYTMIVLRVRGHRCHVCQVLPHQSQSLCCPSSPQLAIKKSSETLRSQHCNIGVRVYSWWCLPSSCVQFAVFNSDKIRHPAALDMQSMPVKKRHDTAPLPSVSCLSSHGFLESRGKRTREQSAPIYSRPHPCGYLHQMTTQGFTCESRDRSPVEYVTKDRSSVVSWVQHASSPPRLLKARTRPNKVLCDFKTLISHSTATATYTSGIPNSREATQVVWHRE